MLRKPGSKQGYELLRATLVTVGDVQINNRFAFQLEVGLKEREMSVLDFGHDEDLVGPVDELLSDFLHGKVRRAGRTRLVLT